MSGTTVTMPNANAMTAALNQFDGSRYFQHRLYPHICRELADQQMMSVADLIAGFQRALDSYREETSAITEGAFYANAEYCLKFIVPKEAHEEVIAAWHKHREPMIATVPMPSPKELLDLLIAADSNPHYQAHLYPHLCRELTDKEQTGIRIVLAIHIAIDLYNLYRPSSQPEIDYDGAMEGFIRTVTPEAHLQNALKAWADNQARKTRS